MYSKKRTNKQKNYNKLVYCVTKWKFAEQSICCIDDFIKLMRHFAFRDKEIQIDKVVLFSTIIRIIIKIT